MLYRSAVFVSSEIGDGDLHEQAHFPIILAGSAGGALTAGKHAYKCTVPGHAAAGMKGTLKVT